MVWGHMVDLKLDIEMIIRKVGVMASMKQISSSHQSKDPVSGKEKSIQYKH
jgi:hypothetical protein